MNLIIIGRLHIVAFCLFSGAVASLGKEQFLGLYLSAGVISSFTSYLFKAVTKQPGLSLGAVSILRQLKCM